MESLTNTSASNSNRYKYPEPPYSMTSCVTLSNGVKMPIFGFGTFLLQKDSVRYPVQVALESGYRLIDTAKLYDNERQIGQVLKQFLQSHGLNREDVFITTKLWKGDMGYASTKQAIDISLKNLGLDYVDLYLIHWPGVDDVIKKNPVPVRDAIRVRRETWKAMEEIHKSGKAKSIGVSNFTVRHLKQLLGDDEEEDSEKKDGKKKT